LPTVWLYSKKDIVEYIGIHYITVSRAIKKIEAGRGKVILQDLTP